MGKFGPGVVALVRFPFSDLSAFNHGRPAGVLIGFDSEEAWFEYRLEHHPDFLTHIQTARAAIRGGEGVRLEDIPA